MYFLYPNEQFYVIYLRHPTTVHTFLYPKKNFTYFLLDTQQVYVVFLYPTNKFTYFLSHNEHLPPYTLFVFSDANIQTMVKLRSSPSTP